MTRKPRKPKGKTILTLEIDDAIYNTVAQKLAARGTDVETYLRLSLRAFTRLDVILNLSSKMTFGKYNGELVEDVCRVNPSYIRWIVAESNNVKFDMDVLELLETLV